MVESLKVEIALDGGEEVQSQMYNIGAAGRQAFLGIADAATKLSAVLAAGIGVGIVVATRKLIDFANAAEETEKVLTQLQKVSGVSFENLSSLSNVFAQGGTPLKKFASEFENLSEKITAAGQQAKIRIANKDTVRWANNIDNVRSQFDNLSRGVTQAFNPLTTLDTKVKAVLESLAKKPVSMIPGVVTDVTNAEEQFSKLADIFKNLRSDMERVQLGKALGLSPETITTLSQGSEKIRQLQAEVARLGLTPNQQALQEMAAQWNQFSTLLSAVFQKIGSLAAPAFGQLLMISKGVVQQIIADFQNMPLDRAIANLSTRLGPAFTALGTALLPIVSATGTAILDSFKAALTPTTSLWDAILNDFNKFGESLVQNASILGEKIKRALDFSGGGGGGAAPATGGQKLAAGGFIGGRGTGTSDSNLAWVSRGEYITPARAVRQPGVLAFLEALRRSGGNLSRALDGMGHFALGGMVMPRAMPAFAAGGLAGGGNNVTIQFPGLPAISGLRASSGVVDELRKAAALAQVRSGGRKPSRYS